MDCYMLIKTSDFQNLCDSVTELSEKVDQLITNASADGMVGTAWAAKRLGINKANLYGRQIYYVPFFGKKGYRFPVQVWEEHLSKPLKELKREMRVSIEVPEDIKLQAEAELKTQEDADV